MMLSLHLHARKQIKIIFCRRHRGRRMRATTAATPRSSGQACSSHQLSAAKFCLARTPPFCVGSSCRLCRWSTRRTSKSWASETLCSARATFLPSLRKTRLSGPNVPWVLPEARPTGGRSVRSRPGWAFRYACPSRMLVGG